mmetsp:Transcript_34159/g.89827  ORF Transcript_34159/g.89827 Transcript_34159/m.89827 type:complete len:203 (+) Transcript_34159:1112-1720(+)
MRAVLPLPLLGGWHRHHRRHRHRRHCHLSHRHRSHRSHRQPRRICRHYPVHRHPHNVPRHRRRFRLLSMLRGAATPDPRRVMLSMACGRTGACAARRRRLLRFVPSSRSRMRCYARRPRCWRRSVPHARTKSNTTMASSARSTKGTQTPAVCGRPSNRALTGLPRWQRLRCAWRRRARMCSFARAASGSSRRRRPLRACAHK